MNNQNSSDITRIQVEKVGDWKRVENDFTVAISDTISQKLAQSSSEHVREAVTAHLLQWRDRTFNAAKHNLRVNGQNLEDYICEEDDIEPFDEVLDRRIWSLSTECMTWDKELADRRRTAPIEVQYLVEDLLARQRATELNPPIREEDETQSDDEVRLRRAAEVGEIFNNAISIFEYLKSTTPLVLSRIERAHKVADEIRCLPP